MKRAITLLGAHVRHSWRRIAGSVAAMSLVFVLAPHASLAFGFGDGIDNGPGRGLASDPMVGTLPMVGSTATVFDQTLTLRGRFSDIRAALSTAPHGKGYFEVIDLGNDEAWMRFYGDVTVELDLAKLASVKVGLFAGFEGGGMRYAITTATTASAPLALQCGSELDLNPLRLDNSGLLSDPVFIHGMHVEGTRTTTSMELNQAGDLLTIRQDV